MSRPTSTSPRLVLSAAAAALALGLLGCGGGTDVVPADPEVSGDGFATAILGGETLGETELVEGALSPGATTDVTVTETVTFTSDIVQLENDMLIAMGITVTDGVTTFMESADYDVDRATGTLTRIASGAIPAGATVDVTYTFTKQLFNLRVSAIFVEGTFAVVSVSNVDPDATGPLTLTNSQVSPPPVGQQAFYVRVEVDTTGPAGTSTELAVVEECDTSTDPTACPFMNVAVIDSYDASNTLNPCVAGSTQVTLATQNGTGPERFTLDMDFIDPLC